MAKEDRRIQKTKAAIAAALMSLLEEKDFSHISINDIAERANVNRGTIYFHYEDKYDLLNKLMDKKLKELKETCQSIDLNFSPQKLEVDFCTVYRFFDENYRFFKLMLDSGAPARFQEKFKALLLNEMQRNDGFHSKDIDKEFLLQFKASALSGVIEWWICENHNPTIEEMSHNTVQLFLKKADSPKTRMTL